MDHDGTPHQGVRTPYRPPLRHRQSRLPEFGDGLHGVGAASTGHRPGDEVITTAYTYTASASVVCHVGARVVLVDTAPDSFEMDYDRLADAITERTKAVIPVDLGGVVCNYDRIYAAVESKRSLFRPANELQEGVRPRDRAGRCRACVRCSATRLAVRRDRRFHVVFVPCRQESDDGRGRRSTWRPIAGVDDEWLYKQFQLLSLHGQSKDALAKTQLGAWEYDIVHRPTSAT